MIFKVIGAALVIAASGSFGFQLAANHKRKEKMLRQIIDVIDFMICELEYRLTPLPALSRQAAQECSGPIGSVILSFSQELEKQTAVNAGECMANALIKHKPLPNVASEAMLQLGKNLGRFELQGQLRGLGAVKQHCADKLAILNRNQDNRLRGYKTLALCAGAALAILFI